MDEETTHDFASGYGVFDVIEDGYPEPIDLASMAAQILFAPFQGAEGKEQ